MRIPLLITAIACASCAPEQYPVEIQFNARMHGTPISCNTGSNETRLTDLRFYVSNVRLLGVDDEWHTLLLTPDDMWQNEQVALVDLESGDGACLNGSAEMNSRVRGTIAVQPRAGLAFEIGVPEPINHNNPLLAAPPLNYTEMHWHWASGYKFMRAGVEKGNDGFFLHLGSNRCAGTIGDIRGCQGANRSQVSLHDFRIAQHAVTIDIGALFADVDLDDGAAGECMSGPVNSACRAPFGALGIDFDNGTAIPATPAVVTGRGQ